MYTLPLFHVPRRLIFSARLHLYLVGAEWLQRATLVKQKGAPGENKLCVLSVPFSMGRIMKTKYCRTEKVLLETGWKEPSLSS